MRFLKIQFQAKATKSGYHRDLFRLLQFWIRISFGIYAYDEGIYQFGGIRDMIRISLLQYPYTGTIEYQTPSSTRNTGWRRSQNMKSICFCCVLQNLRMLSANIQPSVTSLRAASRNSPSFVLRVSPRRQGTYQGLTERTRVWRRDQESENQPVCLWEDWNTGWEQSPKVCIGSKVHKSSVHSQIGELLRSTQEGDHSGICRSVGQSKLQERLLTSHDYCDRIISDLDIFICCLRRKLKARRFNPGRRCALATHTSKPCGQWCNWEVASLVILKMEGESSRWKK